MKNHERIAGEIQECKNEMWHIFQTIKNHKWKILWAIAGLSIFWAVANHHDTANMAEWWKEQSHEQKMKYDRVNQLQEEAEGRQIDREKRVDQGMKTPE